MPTVQADLLPAGTQDDVQASTQQPRATPTVVLSRNSSSKEKNEIYQGLIMLAEGYIDSPSSAERFRMMRAKIERLNLGDRRLKLLAITSAVPSEGKSVVAVNLARALSIDPVGKTLIIDCDLRKPSVQKFFRTSRDGGLSDALLSKKLLNKFIRPVAPGLDLITAGTPVVDPMEAIEQPEFAAFISQLKEHYRYIVLDCPPALICPEPIRISSLADATFLVARAWRTNRGLVREAVELIGRQRILGVVLNEGLDGSHQYNDYGYYNYYTNHLSGVGRKS